MKILILLAISLLIVVKGLLLLSMVTEADKLNQSSQTLESVLVIKLNNTREQLRVADMRANYLEYLLDQKKGKK